MLPEDLNRELTRRLHRWGLWRRINKDPGIGYPRKNILHVPVPGDMADAAAPTDWSDAEQVDMAVRAMTMLRETSSTALEAEYIYRGSKESKMDMWHYLLRQTNPDRERMSYRSYRAALADGRTFVAGWVMRLEPRNIAKSLMKQNDKASSLQ